MRAVVLLETFCPYPTFARLPNNAEHRLAPLDGEVKHLLCRAARPFDALRVKSSMAWVCRASPVLVHWYMTDCAACLGLVTRLGWTNLAQARRQFDAHPDLALQLLFSSLG